MEAAEQIAPSASLRGREEESSGLRVEDQPQPTPTEVRQSRPTLRVEGARVYVSDLLVEAEQARMVVLARFYGAREAVRAVASALWLRQDVFYCAREEADAAVAEQLARGDYPSGIKGVGRVKLEDEITYERHHYTVRPGVSVLTLLHPRACGRGTEEGRFYVIAMKEASPVPLFVRAAGLATTIPLPEGIGEPLWERLVKNKHVGRLKGVGHFRGFKISVGPWIAAAVSELTRKQAKVIPIGSARKGPGRKVRHDTDESEAA